MSEYIQIKTGLSKAVVTAVGSDSVLRINSGRFGDTSATTYLDAKSALLLAAALIEAAKHLDQMDDVEVLPSKVSGLLGALP